MRISDWSSAVCSSGLPRSAAGFFARADAISPNQGRVKAGLARSMLKMEKPSEAVRYFDDAARLGVKDADIASDRGLALDLTGDPERAKREYKLALDRRPGEPALHSSHDVSLGIKRSKDRC